MNSTTNNVNGYESVNLYFVDPSPAPPISTPGPTPPTFKWRTYKFQGDWAWKDSAGVLYMTFHNMQVVFRCDPTYPQFNPSEVVFSCTMTTANQNGHYWQTSNQPRPLVKLTIMGTNDYPIVNQVQLSDVNCMPWDITIAGTLPFDYAQWPSLNYCIIYVGNTPATFWRNDG